MANITISTRSSVDTSTALYAGHISGKVAGADVTAGQPLYLKQSDDKLYPFATGEAFAGIAARNAKAGQPVTAYNINVRFHASDAALTAKVYYVGAGGVISDTATTDDTRGAFLRVGPNDLTIIAAGKLA